VFLGQKIRKDEVKFSLSQVGISIIIAAKNEEKNIQPLIESLKNLEWQQDNFEVIFVDDHSKDKTMREIEKSINGFKEYGIISLSEFEIGGKRNALTKGIEKAQFENIVITDADCRPGPNWLNSYSKKFSENFDFIFGIAPFKQDNFLVNKIACFENLRSSILTFSFAGIGLPYSAAARNIGFTKRAFEILGGYSKTNQTISGDDDLMLREAVKNKLKISTLADKGSYVYSETKKTFRDYLNQKARHTQTSIHYLAKHKIFLLLWHLMNLFSLSSVLLMIYNPLWGVLFATKIFVDLSVVKMIERKFGYGFSLFEIIFLQIIYELLLILHFINARFMKIKWK
jgi:cellulose synthase/poly-beta-1,6-N-acetylglucosamine synthase-like glycosyltransferase